LNLTDNYLTLSKDLTNSSSLLTDFKLRNNRKLQINGLAIAAYINISKILDGIIATNPFNVK
tara:strand:+ start:694 stop:879 length:186 start_codon:yes stop_codon:yes gene_type:complete